MRLFYIKGSGKDSGLVHDVYWVIDGLVGTYMKKYTYRLQARTSLHLMIW